MSEAIVIALIVSIAPTVTALFSIWQTMAHQKVIIPKLDHITGLANSTLTAANKRIDDLEKEVVVLKHKLEIPTLSTLWNREPAMILGVINSGIALGITFGLHLTVEQIGAIMAFSSTVLALITRSQVSWDTTKK